MHHTFNLEENGTKSLDEWKDKGWKIDEDSDVIDNICILYDCDECYSGKFEESCMESHELDCECDCHRHCVICGTDIIKKSEPWTQDKEQTNYKFSCQQCGWNEDWVF